MNLFSRFFTAGKLTTHLPDCTGDCANCALTLTGTCPGQTVCLVAVRDAQTLNGRLAELGLTPGVHISVVQDAGTALIVAVRGARVAIGRDVAGKLHVEPVAVA